MKREEFEQRGLLIDENRKVLDQDGNEYRNEEGSVEYLEEDKKIKKRTTRLRKDEMLTPFGVKRKTPSKKLCSICLRKLNVKYQRQAENGAMLCPDCYSNMRLK